MQAEQFNNLLRVMKLVGGKFIIVEDGEPQAVLMSYQEFSNMAEPEIARNLVTRFGQVEEFNREITRAQLSDLRDSLFEGVIAADETALEPEIRIEPLI